jgi:16S rRNA (cytosine967-C5)-methyltransferase
MSREIVSSGRSRPRPRPKDESAGEPDTTGSATGSAETGTHTPAGPASGDAGPTRPTEDGTSVADASDGSAAVPERTPGPPRKRKQDAPPPPAGVAARRLAADALVRVDEHGAYANIVLPRMLERSELDKRDRAFATELVYGVCRMRRACDWLVDRFVLSDLDPLVRALLRVGAFQLVFLDTPPHAAVAATVEASPRKVRGLVNAVLRRVSTAGRDWPDAATELSYPDWIIDRLTDDLGQVDGIAALRAMNEAAAVTQRADGYVQDRSSLWVADAVEAGAGDRVLDVCAAPGGKSTAIGAAGARVVAADLRPSRVGLIRSNVGALGVGDRVWPVAADGTRPPFPAGSFDRVLVDAPCSGLGSLRRRPDARWRIADADVAALAALQVELLDAVLPLVRPGGVLTYSVCTLTRAETIGIDEHLEAAHPDWSALPLPDDGTDDGTGHGQPTGAAGRWRPAGRGGRVLPQDAGTDGMYLLRLRAPG